MKTCSKCNVAKAESNFHRKGDRLNAQCKMCDAERKRKWREANPAKVKAIRRRHYMANPERDAARKRKWREANPDKEREARLKRLGANVEDSKRGKADSKMVEEVRRKLQRFFRRHKL